MSIRPPQSGSVLRWAVCILAGLSATLPWWHNHGYLRDFMDYGLVMAGIGRMNEGQHPYVDFVTSIQAGFLWFNALIERLGGGTYPALTRGGLGLIVVTFVALVVIARRRWSLHVAALAAWVVVVASASQHLILWHNTLGVACLAVTGWIAALHPTLQRRAWAWHTLLLLTLVVSGLNKLNFHLLCLALVVGFALRAALLNRKQRGAAAGLIGLSLLAGTVVPLLIELAGTGATLAQWRHNVLEIAASGRAGYLTKLLDPIVFIKPIHNYYGPLLFPAIGGLALVWSFAVVATGWCDRRPLDRLLLVGAALVAFLSALALLATNQEIAYVAGAGLAAMLGAILLGFEIPLDRLGARLVHLLPIILLGSTAWISAWQGQRSQFGHDASPRSAYRTVAPDSAPAVYLRDTLIPPAHASSFEQVGDQIPAPGPDGRRPVIYATATEWLERAYPAIPLPGLPLWMHDNTSYGPVERARLAQVLRIPSEAKLLMCSADWRDLPFPAREIVTDTARRRTIGGQILAYDLEDGRRPYINALLLASEIGGNVHPELLVPDKTLQQFVTNEGRYFQGVSHGNSALHVFALAYRIRGEVILRRHPGAPRREVSASFTIGYAAEGFRAGWTEHLHLAPDDDVATASYEIDARQQHLRFEVVVDGGSDDLVDAGWFTPEIQHARPNDDPPPASFLDQPAPDPAPDAAFLDALCESDWRPDAILTRGARLTDRGIELIPGGQIWVKCNPLVKEFVGWVRADPTDDLPRLPLVRTVWYKGGRLQVMHRAGVRESDHKMEFSAWAAEPEGWFGISIDPGSDVPTSRIAIERVVTQD